MQEAEIRHQQEMAIARHQLEQQEQEKAQLAALATPEPAPEPEVGQSGDGGCICMWGVAMGGAFGISISNSHAHPPSPTLLQIYTQVQPNQYASPQPATHTMALPGMPMHSVTDSSPKCVLELSILELQIDLHLSR